MHGTLVAYTTDESGRREVYFALLRSEAGGVLFPLPAASVSS